MYAHMKQTLIRMEGSDDLANRAKVKNVLVGSWRSGTVDNDSLNAGRTGIWSNSAQSPSREIGLLWGAQLSRYRRSFQSGLLQPSSAAFYRFVKRWAKAEKRYLEFFNAYPWN